MPREFTTYVAGVRFPNANGTSREAEVACLIPGEPVELRLQPKNEHDGNAIAIYSLAKKQIGYIPAERAAWLGGKIRLGEDIRAIFQLRTEQVALIRINLFGEVPTLPAELRSETVTLPPSPAPPPVPLMMAPRRRIDRSGGSQLPEIEPEDVGDYIPPDD